MDGSLDTDAARAICSFGLDLTDLLREAPEPVARPLIERALNAYRRALTTCDEAEWRAMFEAVKTALETIGGAAPARPFARLRGFLGENADLQSPA